jgi:hypothetical protein
MLFTDTYREFIKVSEKSPDFGFNLETVARFERVIAFLYQDWWKVQLSGLQHVPAEGPALLVGNTAPILPWPGLMLMYALMSSKTQPRRLHILANLDAIDDERLYNFAREVGFVSWSADNVKRIFAEGELAVVFPEGSAGQLKPFSERYRVRGFDWTKVMPAIEMKVPIYPLATLGCDESIPVFANLEGVAKKLNLPAFPITPFFPLLPFPFNMMTLPVHWHMKVMKPVEYAWKKSQGRDELEDVATKLSLFIEGEVQAELNRMLRSRIKAL